MLLHKRILASRLEWLDLPSDSLIPWLKQLDRDNQSLYPGNLDTAFHREMLLWGLIAGEGDGPDRSGRLQLSFVTALNLEFTYDCRLACRHCLQTGIRKQMPGSVISATDAIRILEGAWFCGLLETGVNLTGGETISDKVPLPEITEWLKLQGIPFRLNTSGWWGRAERILVGGRRYSDPRELIFRLRDDGLAILALSLDERIEQYPHLVQSCRTIAEICAEAGVSCQVIDTRRDPRTSGTAGKELAGIPLPMLLNTFILSMDTVDIGGSAGHPNLGLDTSKLAGRVGNSECNGKGFCRPTTLHVSPDGGVRGCMYSPGAADFGNVLDTSMPAIVNGFHRQPAVRLFSGNGVSGFISSDLEPFSGEYREVLHPCGATALTARVASDTDGVREKNQLLSIHRNIARQLGLARSRVGYFPQEVEVPEAAW